MTKYFLFLVAVTFASLTILSAQSRETRLRTKGYVNPQEIVSLDSTMRLDQAITVLSGLSKQYAGKLIIDIEVEKEKRNAPIGVYIVNQHWRDALDMICRNMGLTTVEEPEFIRVTSVGAASLTQATSAPGMPTEPPPTLQSRDVKISAVFFNTNLNKLQDYGISWNFFRAKTKEPNMTFYNSANMGRGDTTSPVPPTAGGASGQSNPSLNTAIGLLKSPPEFTFANIDALIKFFGTNSLGEVITSPEVTVRDGKNGKIVVGKDFFITERDIAGNTINQRIETGTIIDVTPTIYTQNDTDFIYLKLNIEQSDVEAGPIINRQTVTTHALLYDGEETVIGGLYSTTDQNTRSGVPVLKDLPWWFFGMRYIFGSDETLKQRQELIILLKAELVDPIRARFIHKTTQSGLIEQKKKEHRKDFENN